MIEDVIQEDKDDLKLEKIESEVKDEEITPLSYDLSIYPADYTLEVLYNKWKKEEIVIPKFQRSYVWNISQASRLIESFMMGLPIPPVFFFIRSDQKYLVIDGRQRLESVFQFFDGYFGQEDKSGKKRIFKLEGINPENLKLYKNSFEELDGDDQRRLKNAVLRVIVVKQIHPSDDDTSIYHIFERLNTGGTTLQDQEVRNCVYYGKLNELLGKLNEYENWRKILGKPKPDSRQKDVQFILRYMSLFHNSSEYKRPMKDFLSKFMGTHRDPPKDFLEKEESRFKEICDVLIKSLGERPFNPKGALNPSVFDAVFVATANHLDSIPSNIKQRFQNLREIPEFIKLTSDATTDVEVVQNRLKLAEKILFG